MANKKRRHYQVKEFDGSDKPFHLENFGNILKMSGVVFTGESESVLIMLPGNPMIDESDRGELTLEDWGTLVSHLDDPKWFEDNDINKPMHRKVRSAISGAVQQQIWVRDNLRCMYCGKGMGVIQLTVDHFVPLELGGKNEMSNYLSACRACNKEKAAMHPRDYCMDKNLDYKGLEQYLKGTFSAEHLMHL